MAVHGVTRADDDKLGEVLAKIHEEEPTFIHEFNAELGQTICRGLGELHLNVQFERMKRKYGVSVETEAPKIAYRETISRSAEGRAGIRNSRAAVANSETATFAWRPNLGAGATSSSPPSRVG